MTHRTLQQLKERLQSVNPGMYLPVTEQEYNMWIEAGYSGLDLRILATDSTVLPPVQTIAEVLAERGSRYGSFSGHADITQRLKAAMKDSPNWPTISDSQKEALEMVAHKIGRILNGDPNYLDSWVDIVGYTQLIVDQLNGKNT